MQGYLNCLDKPQLHWEMQQKYQSLLDRQRSSYKHLRGRLQSVQQLLRTLLFPDRGCRFAEACLEKVIAS